MSHYQQVGPSAYIHKQSTSCFSLFFCGYSLVSCLERMENGTSAERHFPPIGSYFLDPPSHAETLIDGRSRAEPGGAERSGYFQGPCMCSLDHRLLHLFIFIYLFILLLFIGCGKSMLSTPNLTSGYSVLKMQWRNKKGELQK